MNPCTQPSRRQFLHSSLAAGTLAAAAAVPAHAAGDDQLRVGLIGCGGRGTDAAAKALTADRYCRLVALADAFPEKMTKCLTNLQEFASKLDVPPERQFSGFEGYQSLIECSDVVLLCTPPAFRPMHLKAAVEAGKHIFCEKPMAVDGPGVRSVITSADRAREKNLNLVSGFCYRYDPPKREAIRRIHDGAIGDITAIQAIYLTGPIWHVERKPGMSDMEWQMRNWYYFTWLSGDFIVEQHVHNLDKAAWALKDKYPIAATGLGGRQVRTDPKYGHIFDHHAVIFEYPEDVKVFSFCRQMDRCDKDVSDHIIGTKGSCHLMKHTITGPNDWSFRGESENMYQVELNELFAAIRSGKTINDGAFMARSTLMAILGRMATYTGKRVTWDQALNSKEDLMPKLDMGSSLPMPPVAIPGKTKVV
jgi:predicted dehydrogenase